MKTLIKTQTELKVKILKIVLENFNEFQFAFKGELMKFFWESQVDLIGKIRKKCFGKFLLKVKGESAWNFPIDLWTEGWLEFTI